MRGSGQDNFFAQVEQAAFAPSNLIAGLGLSPDPMLLARAFAYPDAQRARLGVNYRQLPVNRPPGTSTTEDDHFDGSMRLDLPQTQNYRARSDDSGSSGTSDITSRAFYSDRAEDFAQPRNFWRLLDQAARARLAANLGRSLSGAAADVRKRQLELFDRVDTELGAAVRAALTGQVTAIGRASASALS